MEGKFSTLKFVDNMGYSQIYTHFPQVLGVEKSDFLSFPQATVLWEKVDKKCVTIGLQ